MSNYKYKDRDKVSVVPFEVLKGKTIIKVQDLEPGSEQAFINCSDGTRFQMTYYNDCCASCSIEEVIGDIDDLLGQEILLAEEVKSRDPHPDEQAKRDKEESDWREQHPRQDYIGDYAYRSETWTFYKLSTIKGSMTIRWYGNSNGYYSEKATFEQIGI